MGSAFGAGSGADMLQDVLRRKLVEQAQFAQQEQAKNKLAEEIRQADLQNAVQQRQLGQGDQRINLDRQRFGETQRQFNALEPTRIASIDHTRASTADLQRKPAAEQAQRDFTLGRDKSQHGYQMQEIGAQGANALRVANVRHPDPAAGPTQQQQNEVEDTLALIDQIAADQALPTSVGPIDQYIGAARDMTGVNRFKSLHEQLTGKMSLAQAGKLRGQGQISDKERAMLAAAATALNRGLSENDYKAELGKIKGQFERMRAAGGGPAPAGAPPAGAAQEFDYVPGKGLVPRGGK